MTLVLTRHVCRGVWDISSVHISSTYKPRNEEMDAVCFDRHAAYVGQVKLLENQYWSKYYFVTSKNNSLGGWLVHVYQVCGRNYFYNF